MNADEWEFDVVLLWANYLTVKKISKNEFEFAKTASIDLDFPPNNAKEFLELARKQYEIFPNVRMAYLNACHQEYTHEVEFETASRVGFWDLQTRSEKYTWKIWQEIYHEVCDEFLAGERFALPQSHRIEEQHIPASTEFAMEILQKIKREVGF